MNYNNKMLKKTCKYYLFYRNNLILNRSTVKYNRHGEI